MGFWEGVWPGRGKDFGTQDQGPRAQSSQGREGGGKEEDPKRIAAARLPHAADARDAAREAQRVMVPKLRRCQMQASRTLEWDPSVGLVLVAGFDSWTVIGQAGRPHT